MTARDSAFLQALYRLQEGPLALWVTESSWALFFFLIVHTISMGFLAGTGMVVAGRVLGLAGGVPLARTAQLFPLMVAALGTAAVSGVFLVIGYPAKALTNPVFYGKLSLAALALFLTWRLARDVIVGGRFSGAIPARAKLTAVVVIGCWLLAITAGRFLAYTAKVTILAP